MRTLAKNNEWKKKKRKKAKKKHTVVQVRAAQGLLKGKIILDFMSVEQALGTK